MSSAAGAGGNGGNGSGAQVAAQPGAQAAQGQGSDAQVAEEFVPASEHQRVKNEAQNLRLRLKAKEEAEKAAADAAMTQQEKDAKELDELRREREKLTREHKTAMVKSRIEVVALKLGVEDTDACVKLFDWDALELDDKGQPKNVDTLVQALVKSRPWLRGSGGLRDALGTGRADAGQANGGAGARSNVSSSQAMNEFLRSRGQRGPLAQ